MKKKEIMEIKEFEKLQNNKYLKKEELKASCDHKIEKGGKIKSALRPTETDKVMICSVCKQKVDFNDINFSELREASKLIAKAIEFIKTVDDDLDKDLRKQLGATTLILSRIPAYYEKVNEEAFGTNQYDNSNGFGFDNSNGFDMMTAPMFNPAMFMGGYNPYYKNNKHNKNKNKNKNKHNW